MADDSITVGTGGTIGEWYLEDASGETMTQYNEPDADAGTVPILPLKSVTVSRVITLPATFASQEGTLDIDTLPTIYTSPTQTFEMNNDGKKWKIKEDRLVKDDQRVGCYRQLRRYQITKTWVES